jgi:hypothetical protein
MLRDILLAAIVPPMLCAPVVVTVVGAVLHERSQMKEAGPQMVAAVYDHQPDLNTGKLDKNIQLVSLKLNNHIAPRGQDFSDRSSLFH